VRVVMFYHSLVSDWNHGNAHFLRGIATELLARGHEVSVFEPRNSWSRQNLVAEHGDEPIRRFQAAYPNLASSTYDLSTLDLDELLDGADLVLVHEWNDHELVRRIGEYREHHNGFQLLFHDTHHRMVTAPEAMDAYDLSSYDGVLAYGEVLRELYLESGRVPRAWTWHEAADVRVFKPAAADNDQPEGDLVWIGNWGDGERSAELNEFLVQPSRTLSLKTRIHGVRYPAEALQLLAGAGVEFAGWLPNFEAPRVFANFKFTVHVPRRPYVEALPGIPTIRVFEALACGIPLVCSPWPDVEGLFTPGEDFLVARNGREMAAHLRGLRHDQFLRRELARNGLETIRDRHTCAHRVDQLLGIHSELIQPREIVPSL
jgi:spore maturation protein CgeB